MKTSKKAIALSVILVTGTSSAQYYSIPNGYTKVDSAYGTSIYYSKDENTAVQVVDLELAYLKNLTIRKVENRYVFAYPGVYKQVNKAFSVVNGAFFGTSSWNSGEISFPFTPGNDIWTDSNTTRTLCVKNNRAYTRENSYTKPSYANICDFSVTLLSPGVSKSPEAPIGRTYIGIINSTPGSEGRFVAFLVAKEKKQEEMFNLAERWKIDASKLIQADGSSSSQLVSTHFNLYGTVCPYGIKIKFWRDEGCEKRRIPHMIGVFSR